MENEILLEKDLALESTLDIEEERQDPSSRIVPELQNRLRDSGLLTAIVTVESPRFKHYLKKPANLLHDRWVYLERGKDRSVLYRLGTPRGLHQDLVISPRDKKAIVETYDPRLGRKQSIVIDMVDRSVLSNTVTFEFAEGPSFYNYYALGRYGGTLELIDSSETDETVPETGRGEVPTQPVAV